MPREITTIQKYLLILEMAKAYRQAQSFIFDIEELFEVLEPGHFSESDREFDKLKLKLIDTMIGAVEIKINKNKNEETNDFEVED